MSHKRFRSHAAIAPALAATVAVFGPGAHSTADAGGPTEFKSPSGNITCSMSTSGGSFVPFIRGDVADFAYRPPPTPADCGVVFGHTVELEEGHPPQFSCAHDTMAYSNFRVLPYGASAQAGVFRCDSTADGIVCTDNGTHHSFRLSRQSYDLT
jgi:hypothetical protein